MTSEIKAPYNFVPLSNWIFSPSWAEQVSHDVPFEDGLSGTVDLELTAISPMLLGSLKKSASNSAPALLEFHKVGREPVIPASSLKGMFRNVFEIANFGRMKRVNDHRLAIRDVRNSVKEHYRDIIDVNKINAGLLIFDKDSGRWQIKRCDYHEVTQKEINLCYGGKSNFSDNQSVVDKYKSVAGDLVVNVFFNKIYDAGLKSEYRYSISKIDMDGYASGRLVFTGQPGGSGVKVERAKVGEKRRHNNKYTEYIFCESSGFVEIPDKVFSDFSDVYDKDGSDWRFWRESGLAFSDGIPVFFQEEQGVASSFGLSKMYKLPYKNSVSEIIGNSATLHRNDEVIDFSDVIFGHMDEGRGLRGRINITPGRLVFGGGYHRVGPVVLSQPKASYFPNYLEQKGGGYQTYMNDDARLRGWKRYILKGAVDDDLPGPVNNRGKINYSVSSELEPIKEDSKFAFKLHFHNLKPVELGALIWTISFGGDNDRYHSIGMGKSLGLGTVQVKVTGVDVYEMKGISVGDLELYKDLYIDFMDSLVGKVVFGRRWSDTDVYQGLDELTRINGLPHKFTYMSVEQYGDMKGKGKFLLGLNSTKEARVKTAIARHEKISYDEHPILCGLKAVEAYIADRRQYHESNSVSENSIRVEELYTSVNMQSSTWRKRLWKLLTDCKNEAWPDSDKAYLKEKLFGFAYELDEKRALKLEKNILG